MRYRGTDQIILSYHAVSSSWDSPLAVSEAVLTEQLTFLCERGYEGLTFSERERRLRSGDLPHRSVVVTFDDGYESTLKAAPILDSLGLPGTIFPAVAFVESGESLSWPGISYWRNGEHEHELRPLSWNQLAELADVGWEVGSHTLDHRDLLRVDDETLRTQLQGSRAAIAARLGECRTIAYPYGRADERVAAAAAAAGYEAGCTLSRYHRADETYRRPRIALFLNDSGLRLRLKLSRFATAVRESRILAGLSKVDEAPPIAT